jgi:hypothetical protein
LLLHNIHYVSPETLPIIECDEAKPNNNSWLWVHVNASLDESNTYLSATTTNDLGMRISYRKSLTYLFAHFGGIMKKSSVLGIGVPDAGGINMLIIGSTLRLDIANQGVYLDAAVVPLTAEIIQDNAMVIQNMVGKVVQIVVNSAGLEQWKHALPALAERCRTWTHKPTCEYVKAGKAPHTTGYACQFLCSCGMGVFPSGFITGLPEWRRLSKFAVRVAISPCYESPTGKSVAVATAGPSNTASRTTIGKNPTPDEIERVAEIGKSKLGKASLTEGHCVGCGAVENKNGGDLLQCVRCKHAKYCSEECQRKDWKKWHKTICPILKITGWKGLEEATEAMSL